MKLNEPFLFLKHNNGICDLLCTDDFNLLGGLNVTVRAFSRFFALCYTFSGKIFIHRQCSEKRCPCFFFFFCNFFFPVLGSIVLTSLSPLFYATREF